MGGALYHSCNTQSSAPEDGRNNRPKHGELIGIFNKPLLLHLVGCLHYIYINDTRSSKYQTLSVTSYKSTFQIQHSSRDVSSNTQSIQLAFYWLLVKNRSPEHALCILLLNLPDRTTQCRTAAMFVTVCSQTKVTHILQSAER